MDLKSFGSVDLCSFQSSCATPPPSLGSGTPGEKSFMLMWPRIICLAPMQFLQVNCRKTDHSHYVLVFAVSPSAYCPHLFHSSTPQDLRQDVSSVPLKAYTLRTPNFCTASLLNLQAAHCLAHKTSVRRSLRTKKHEIQNWAVFERDPAQKPLPPDQGAQS